MKREEEKQQCLNKRCAKRKGKETKLGGGGGEPGKPQEIISFGGEHSLTKQKSIAQMNRTCRCEKKPKKRGYSK